MTEQEFVRIVVYMKNKNGVDLSKKKAIVQGRLDNYLQTHGFKNYTEYMNCVESDATGREAQNFVDILTTNHTYFMREIEHFEFFRDVILPELKIKETASKDLRIWSAAASSGEEAYTIAMYIKDFLGLEYSQWDTTILATDISRKVLSQAVEGKYTKDQIEAVPFKWRQSNFKRIDENTYEINSEIKKRVLFRQFNLMNQLPLKRKLHVVFLRNVMIYFDDKTKEQLINRMYDYIEDGGYLIIGNTESIDRSKSNFEYIRPSIFRKI